LDTNKDYFLFYQDLSFCPYTVPTSLSFHPREKPVTYSVNSTLPIFELKFHPKIFLNMFPYTQFNPLSQVDNLNAPTNPAKSRLIAWTLKQPYPHGTSRSD